MAVPDIDKSSAKSRLINLTPSGRLIEVFAYYRKPGADWAFFGCDLTETSLILDHASKAHIQRLSNHRRMMNASLVKRGAHSLIDLLVSSFQQTH